MILILILRKHTTTKEDDADWTKGVTYNGEETTICDSIDKNMTSDNDMIPFPQQAQVRRSSTSASPRFVYDGTAAAAAASAMPMPSQQHLLYQRFCQQKHQHYQHQQYQQQQQHHRHRHQYQHPYYQQQQYQHPQHLYNAVTQLQH
jgi:hypothetical protein